MFVFGSWALHCPVIFLLAFCAGVTIGWTLALTVTFTAEVAVAVELF